MGTAFVLLKCLRTQYGRALQTIFRPKMHYIARNCKYNLKIFPESIHKSELPQKHSPTCLDQTQISAWLASVPIVLILRNDHCLWWVLITDDDQRSLCDRPRFVVALVTSGVAGLHAVDDQIAVISSCTALRLLCPECPADFAAFAASIGCTA